MFGLNLKAVMRARRECLRAGSSSLVMGAAASTVMAGEALGFEMIEEAKFKGKMSDVSLIQAPAEDEHEDEDEVEEEEDGA